MNDQLFLSIGYLISLSVGVFVLLQFAIDKDAWKSSSKKALMSIVGIWLLAGFYFFVYDVLMPMKLVPVFAAYTLLFILLVTPFFYNFVSYIMRGRGLTFKEWLGLMAPFGLGVLAVIALNLMNQSLPPVYTFVDFLHQLPALDAIVRLMLALAGIGMQVSLALWTHHLYRRFLTDIAEDFSFTGTIDPSGLIRLVYLYTVVLTAICICFLTLSDPYDYAWVHLLAAPFYATFLAFAYKQRDVYTPVFKPHSDLLEEAMSGPVGSNSRFEVFKVRLRMLLEEEGVWKQTNLTAEDVSLRLGTNRTYLSQIVNEVYGKPFRTVVNAYRVDTVKCMLKSGNYHTMSEIADTAGFASASTMNKVFKSHTGYTPSEFKNL